MLLRADQNRVLLINAQEIGGKLVCGLAYFECSKKETVEVSDPSGKHRFRIWLPGEVSNSVTHVTAANLRLKYEKLD